MAEMTVADAIRIINNAKSYVGQPDDYCSINLTVLEKEQIAALIQQQAATITELQTEIEYQNKQIARLQKDLSKWQVKEGQ